MAESKAARARLRELLVTDRLPSLPADTSGDDLVDTARAQGVAGLLLRAIEAQRPAWAEPLRDRLVSARRERLVRTLAQIDLAGRAIALLEERRLRALPLKGVVLAGTVYDLEADRPMSDVDVLVLERAGEGLEALAAAGFTEVASGDHATALADPASGGIVELHWSLTSCPGLFPLDGEALWTRTRPGNGPLRRLPSPEDLLVQIALHAAFQHGLVLSLVQWLDFRRLLERERIDVARVRAIARDMRAEVPLLTALQVAGSVVGAPVPAALSDDGALPRGLARWLRPQLLDPLGFVHPSIPALARVRWELLAGRRAALVLRTLDTRGPGAGGAIHARLAGAVSRGWALVRRHLLRRRGSTALDGFCRETPLAEAVLRDCLASYDHVLLTVTGGCMRPALNDGERVTLVGPERQRPALGDIVLARLGGGLRLHRLVWGPPLASTATRWRTKADRAPFVDPSVGADDVLGTVVAVEGRERGLRDVPRAIGSLAGAAWARLGRPR